MDQDRKSSILKSIYYGFLTLLLYYFLFRYSDLIVEWAHLTRMGDKHYFILPIVIAFFFSLIHGTFTAHFWTALGIKAARPNINNLKGGKK